MAAANVDEAKFEKQFKDFVTYFIPYTWDFTNPIRETDNLPEDGEFNPGVCNRILTAQFFLRWYCKQFLVFTFKVTTIQSEIKVLWRSWIVNRQNVFEKVVDAVAIIIETALYCFRHKNYTLSIEEGQQVFTECFQELKPEFMENGGWDKFYETNYDYSALTFARQKYDKDFMEYSIPPYSDLGNYFQHSLIKFPKPPKFGEEKNSYVFVRLHSEMDPYRISTRHISEPGTVVSAYYPRDRKPYYWNAIVPTSAKSMDNRIYRDETPAQIDVDQCIKNFALNVLKLKEGDYSKLFLISEKYNDSFETFLSMRYNQIPGSYVGASGVPSENSTYTQKRIYIVREAPPNDEINWIVAAHLVVDWSFTDEPIITDAESLTGEYFHDLAEQQRQQRKALQDLAEQQRRALFRDSPRPDTSAITLTEEFHDFESSNYDRMLMDMDLFEWVEN